MNDMVIDDKGLTRVACSGILRPLQVLEARQPQPLQVQGRALPRSIARERGWFGWNRPVDPILQERLGFEATIRSSRLDHVDLDAFQIYRRLRRTKINTSVTELRSSPLSGATICNHCTFVLVCCATNLEIHDRHLQPYGLGAPAWLPWRCGLVASSVAARPPTSELQSLNLQLPRYYGFDHMRHSTVASTDFSGFSGLSSWSRIR
jgi:hypothetical protein